MPTILTDNRDTALKVGYEATDWSTPIAFDDYLQSMSGWSVQGIERDGKCIGAVYKKDGEVHVSVLKDWRKRWMTKGLIRSILGPDVTRTEVVPGHEYMFGILARLGMKNVSSYKFEVSHGH
jgi:hypothetical protein